MNNNEIIAATETAYELVETYSRDLQSFIDNLRGEANSVAITLRNMNTYWDGTLYDDFAKNINAKLAKIDTAAPIGKSLADLSYEGLNQGGLYKKLLELELHSFIGKVIKVFFHHFNSCSL